MFVYLRTMTALLCLISSILYGSLDDVSNNACRKTCLFNGPLYKGFWGISLKGGVRPTYWTERPNLILTNRLATPPVFKLTRISNLQHLYDIPWTIGGELSYNVTNHIQLFIEGNYISGRNKPHTFTWTNDAPAEIINDDFREYGGHLGARYYFQRCICCGCVAPFIGAKIGAITHKRVNSELKVNDLSIDTSVFLNGGGGVSAGVQFGFDVQLWDTVYATLNFECVCSEPHRPANNEKIDIPSFANSITNMSVGPLGTEIGFPITASVRYEF